MAWFICNNCGGIANSDDGCMEDPHDRYASICTDCACELEIDDVERDSYTKEEMDNVKQLVYNNVRR